MSSPAKLAFFHQKQNFFPKIFGSSKYSSYLCHRLTDDSSLSGRATVSPMASCRRLFYAQEYHFPGNGKKVYLYGGCMNRRFD